ncbi:hypothetical protein M2G63_19755 [Vibrio vulnificus]|nr:hypothetical protein [Vibrio vulnificus]MCU8540295.1 hypothetical protein [Vibrio vulnificus]MCU8541459.1 hypothetical protein [Vibrio vulnificus]HAT8521808.1 hypothetical protein [Vibrio vulnificus]
MIGSMFRKLCLLALVFAALQLERPFISQDSLNHFSAVYDGHEGNKARFQVTADSLTLGKNLVDTLRLNTHDKTVEAYSRSSDGLKLGDLYIGTMQVVTGKNGYLKVYELFDDSGALVREKMDKIVVSGSIFNIITVLSYVLCLLIFGVFYRVEKSLNKTK